jgi:hypothetical protein
MEKHGKILGVPYDFRRPTLARIRERMWNPDDPHIFTPRVFGAGWDINFATLKERNKAGFAIAVTLTAIIYIRGFLNLKKSLDRAMAKLKGNQDED